MKKLLILQTPVRFYPYVGGVEFLALYLSRELINLGHKVKVICSNEPKSKNRKYEGIDIRRLNYQLKIANTNICLTLPFYILTEKYDLIQTYLPTPWVCDLSVLISKIRHIKSVVFIANDLDKPGFLGHLITSIYLNTLFRLTLTLTDKILVCNENWNASFANTKHILNNYKDKIVEIPLGVDTKTFRPLHIKRDPKTLVFVSILDKHHTFKGLKYLLVAIKNLSKEIPKIKLIVSSTQFFEQVFSV